MVDISIHLEALAFLKHWFTLAYLRLARRKLSYATSKCQPPFTETESWKWVGVSRTESIRTNATCRPCSSRRSRANRLAWTKAAKETHEKCDPASNGRKTTLDHLPPLMEADLRVFEDYFPLGETTLSTSRIGRWIAEMEREG